MMKRTERSRWILALAAATVLLGACGGGGKDDDPVPPPDPLAAVPESASQASAGLVAYLLALAINKSETREPVTLDGFDPPRPDNTEPEPVF
jgi:hypothetical protein